MSVTKPCSVCYQQTLISTKRTIVLRHGNESYIGLDLMCPISIELNGSRAVLYVTH